MEFADRSYANARINPVRATGRVTEVMKMDCGSLRVTQADGNIFTIAPDDECFMAFLVWMVINPDAA